MHFISQTMRLDDDNHVCKAFMWKETKKSNDDEVFTRTQLMSAPLCTLLQSSSLIMICVCTENTMPFIYTIHSFVFLFLFPSPSRSVASTLVSSMAGGCFFVILFLYFFLFLKIIPFSTDLSLSPCSESSIIFFFSLYFANVCIYK